jgi:hypothetical protein
MSRPTLKSSVASGLGMTVALNASLENAIALCTLVVVTAATTIAFLRLLRARDRRFIQTLVATVKDNNRSS